MTAGTIFLMWLGEQIDELGIGNGISLLIMAGILARLPYALKELFAPLFSTTMELSGEHGLDKLIMLVLLFIGIIVGVVFITTGQRRIPMQSAKHVRGRRVFGGTRNYLPLRVNQAGVMPIIFASSLLLFPAMLFDWLANSFSGYPGWGWLYDVSQSVGGYTSFVHNVLYVAMIYFFCYFWTAITFNPKDMADNLKNWGTFIPGYRPGRRTADYLEKVMIRITYVGAGFLSLVAILPTLVSSTLTTDAQIASMYGGTSILIAVSVAFDLVQKIDSHLIMRNYKGLLE
jgi:preprotein translocase subunit SecY